MHAILQHPKLLPTTHSRSLPLTQTHKHTHAYTHTNEYTHIYTHADASHPRAPKSKTIEKLPQELLTEVAVGSSGGGDRGQRGLAEDGQQSGKSKMEQQQGGVPRDEAAEDAAFAAFDGELRVQVKSARA